MKDKDFYEKMTTSEIDDGIQGFIKHSKINAGSITIDNFNLYELLHAYFGDKKLRIEMNEIAEKFHG